MLRALVVGQKNDFTVVGGSLIVGCARRLGANPATGPGSGAILDSDYVGANPPPAVRTQTSGNSLLVQVRGVNPDIYQWTAQIAYQFVRTV